jgi:omega-6 fatty acid desaturase (delta-12 desaturase)
MDTTLNAAAPPPNPKGLRASIAPYETASPARSLFQFISSTALFAACWALMLWSLKFSYFLTLPLAVLTAGFVVRIFIIQHDCGHGSFFKSRRANQIVGSLCSVMTFTPYASWRRQHAGHHANWNNLDRRESGADIYSACMTVKEYQALSRRQRFTYRLIRHPIVSHILIPPLVFLLLYRVPFDTPKDWTVERRSVYWLDFAMLTVFGGLSALFGWKQVLMIQLPIICTSSIVGVWLFALQHRFEGVVWARQAEWSFTNAALDGSSYLELPRVLQWFTGNIGFHHIHHLSPRVPNYRLQACHENVPAVQRVKTLNMRSGFRASSLALWDEVTQTAVRFADAKAA